MLKNGRLVSYVGKTATTWGKTPTPRYLANQLILKCTLQFKSAMEYGDSTTWGQYAHGRLTLRFLCHIAKHSKQISGLISCILTEHFISMILVYNKAYLHFHVTTLYLFEIFNTAVITSLGQNTTWQNRRVKRSHSRAFCPKRWWAFSP